MSNALSGAPIGAIVADKMFAMATPLYFAHDSGCGGTETMEVMIVTISVMRKPSKLIVATTLIVLMLAFACLGANSDQILTHEEEAWIKANPTIRVGLPDIPPFCFYEDGRAKGFYVDIFQKVLQKAGLTAEYTPALPGQEIIEGLRTNRFDAALALIVSPEHKAFLDFANHHFSQNITIFARKRDSSITDLPSMEGKTVSTYAGYGLNDFIKKHFDPSHVIMTDNAEEMMRLVDCGKADACIKELHTGTYIILQGNLHSLEPKGLISIGDKLGIADAIWAVGKKASVLGDILNKAYSHIPLAEVQALRKEWFLTDAHASTDLRLTPKEKAWLAQNHVIRARVTYWPPYQFWDNGPQGISVDYLKRIAEKYGLNIEFYRADRTWNEALENIRNFRRPDLLTTIHYAPEREGFIVFSKDYLDIPWVIFSQKEGAFYTGIEDLNGKTVAVQRGFIMQGFLEADYPKIKLLLVDDTLSALKAVSTGAADAFIGNLAVGAHIIQEAGLSNLKVAAPTPFKNHTQAFGVRKDWPELASILSKGIAGISPEERSAIKHKWLSVRYEYGIRPKDVLKWVFTVSSVLLSILSIILIWNRKLNKEILERQRIEQHLRESENKYRCLSEASFEGILLLKDQTIIDVNLTTAKMFGYESTEEIIGKKAIDFVSPEYREEVQEKIVRNNNKPSEIKGIKKDGTIFPIEAYGKLFVYKGDCIRVQAIRDLTEKKKAEEEIKQLRGIIPICMHCKGIRDDEGYWNELEKYISEHSDVQFSHGVCDNCMDKYYPEFKKKIRARKSSRR